MSSRSSRAQSRPLFTKRATLEKAVNSLLGLFSGVSIDTVVNDGEIAFLNRWLEDHRHLSSQHPFTELIPAISRAIADGNIDAEEVADIEWMCCNLKSDEYFDDATGAMQKLHGVVAGIGADGVVREEELRGLSAWISEHNHLRSCWPYDEVEGLVTGVLADGKIDPEEHAQLMAFFGEFVAILDNKTITNPRVAIDSKIVGVCAVCPTIEVSGSRFCFTGVSHRYSREEFRDVIERRGGTTSPGISKKIDYLVVGADGNPCWTYACYGRKVEQAVALRKAGHPIQIIHENDLHDVL